MSKMRQPKVGDKVRRVESGNFFPKGNIYTVEAVGANGLFYVEGWPTWSCSPSEQYWELIEEEGEKDMLYKDLKAGMRVETSNGKQGLVVSDGGGHLYLLLSYDCSAGKSIRTHYNYDLTHSSPSQGGNDIMKVWDCYPTGVQTACDLSKELPTRPTWERKEVKELTVAEIEKLLGHSVKIVK